MRPSNLLLELYSDKPIMGRTRLEIDGLPCTLENFWSRYYPGSIVRVNKHLYMDMVALTVGAPEWGTLWESRRE